jgi:cell wall-associated NlpC family hydrolase
MKSIWMLKFTFLSIMLVISCDSGIEKQEDLQKTLSFLLKRLEIDKALSINQFTIKKIDGRWSLVGKTNEKRVYNSLQFYADSLSYFYSIKTLPDSALKDSIFGIVNVSVTPIRQEPKHSSQMVDQAILGNYVKLYEKEEDWFLCQTEYDYVGWINKTAIQKCDKKELYRWREKALHKVISLSGTLYSKPNRSSLPITDVVLNNLIKKTGNSGQWGEFILPDGRKGYLHNKDYRTIKLNGKSNQAIILNITKTAKKLIGTPYLWGGNSTKGSDCSGFTQLIFKSEGVFLPRDARQQALLGEFIETGQFSVGDLLFFGDGIKVTHVGMSLGGFDFIHQGGKVEIHSIDKNSSIFNKYRTESFMFAKRII